MNFRMVFVLPVLYFVPQTCFAVLPPDIIFSLGTQLWQIVVGAGALAFGSVAALFPFFRSASIVTPMKRVVLFFVAACLILGGLGYLVFITKTKTKDAIVNPQTTADTNGYEFHANRFVFLGKKVNGDPVLINLNLNRKELLEGGFVHYYVGDIVIGTSSTSINAQQVSHSRNVLPDFFFTHFVRTLPEDHSAREAYALAFSVGGRSYQFQTDMITSDFLIKNEPEYTAYIGVGRARGVVDGEEIEFHTMIERIYSTDYRPTIFFDPEEKLPSETVQLVLWDDLGDFLLIDRSKVDSSNPGYASHFWGLARPWQGFALRHFEGDAVMIKENGLVKFEAYVGPKSLEPQLKLQLIHPFSGEEEEGYVEGEFTDPESPGKYLRGMGYHHIYGPKK